MIIIYQQLINSANNVWPQLISNCTPGSQFWLLIVNKINLTKFWRPTCCRHIAANKMVNLTLYSKGGVKANYCISWQPKLVIWKAQLYFHMFDKNVYHYYLYPHTIAVEMVGVVGSLWNNKMLQFPLEILKRHTLHILYLACLPQ